MMKVNGRLLLKFGSTFKYFLMLSHYVHVHYSIVDTLDVKNSLKKWDL